MESDDKPQHIHERGIPRTYISGSQQKQKNIKDYLVRAKISTSSKRPQRLITGMKKCGKQCPICPFILENKYINGKNFQWKIGKQLNCQTKNVIYMIECDKQNCKNVILGRLREPYKKGFLNIKDMLKTNI